MEQLINRRFQVIQPFITQRRWFIWMFSMFIGMHISHAAWAVISPSSTSRIQMFREQDGQVYTTGQGLMSGYIEDRGTLMSALPADSTGYYILSDETPIATQPLVLIGTVTEILSFFATRPNSGIENRFKDLSTIYMIMTPYQPVKSRYKVNIPIFAVAKHFTKRLKSAVNALVDPPKVIKALESSVDGLEFAKKFKSYTKKLKGKHKEEVFYVKFSYLKEEPKSEKLKRKIKNFEIGRGRVSFKELLDNLYQEFKKDER